MKPPLLILLLLFLISLPMEASAQPASRANPNPVSSDQPNAASTASPTPNASLSSNERFEYDKLRLERELQKEIWDWVVWRFWIVAALIVLVGFFGIRAFVREMIASELKDAARAAAQAEAAAKLTTDVTPEVRADADKYKGMIVDLSDAATKLDERFKSLDARITAEGAHAIASSELQLSQLAGHVQELSAVVQRLASESRENREALEKYNASIQKIDRVAADRKAEFSANSKYSIQVVHHPLNPETINFGKKLLVKLASLGYRASSGKWSEGSPSLFEEIDVSFHGDNEGVAKEIKDVVDELASTLKPNIPIKLTGGLHDSVGADVAVFLPA